MNTFHLTISSPDGDIFSGQCCKIILRGTEGELCVMANHASFVTAVVKCECSLWTDEDRKMDAVTEGGLLSVDREGATFISGTFKFLNN